ncbi:MAG: hypothetical protein LUE27_11475 [Clostridia bacterium]|nr:hypothetical protein [Clostridia bacterium]
MAVQGKNSIYFSTYEDQIAEMATLAADMDDEFAGILQQLSFELPQKDVEFYVDDDAGDGYDASGISWWNSIVSIMDDIDMKPLLLNEELDCEWYQYDHEKIKRINAVRRLKKDQFFEAMLLVTGFVVRWMQLKAAFDVISGCIDELEYNQSLIRTKDGEAKLPETAYL